jgi:hypothetical protein
MESAPNIQQGNSRGGPMFGSFAVHRRFRIALLSIPLCLSAGFLAPLVRAQQAQPETVQLRITLELPDTRANRALRQATVELQPLENQSQGQTVTVSEGITAILNLPPGRYEITSTQPVDVDGQPYGWDVEVPLMYHTNDLRLSQENAVRVSDEQPGPEQPAMAAASSEPPNPEPPAPSSAPSVTGSHTASAPPSSSISSAPPTATVAESAVTPAVREEIEDLLDRWTYALRNHNLTEEMTCYASRLSAYFRQRDVSQDFVRRDKQRFFQRYPEVRQLALSDVQIFEAGDHPEVRARKTWSFGGHKDWTGQVITHLELAKEQGRWVIVSERERLVHQNVPFGGGRDAAARGQQ